MACVSNSCICFIIVVLARLNLTMSVDTEGRTCTADSDYIARWTLSSSIVFEGRFDNINFQASNRSEYANATFTFKRAFKGNSKVISDAKTSAILIVGIPTSGISSTGSADCSDEATALQSLIPMRNYVIFANRSTTLAKSAVLGQPATVFYSVTKLPQASTKTVIDLVRGYGCAKCGKIKLKLTPKQSELRQGKKLMLKCQVSGKPMPAVKWLKNKQIIEADDRINVTLIKQVSYLIINKVTSSDSGIYQCQSVNPLAVTNSSVSSVRIDLGADESFDAHAEPCATSDYCLNGGRCLVLQSLGRKYCSCPRGFSGYRCFHNSINRADSQVNIIGPDETYVISGIAIGTLIFAGVVITVFCIARNWCEKKRRRRRQGTRNNVYRPPSLPDGHIFNVNQLNAAICQQSTTEYSNLSGNSAAFTSFDSADVNGVRRAMLPQHHPHPVHEYELPVMRNEHRSSSHFNADNGVSQRTSSFQVQLQRLSMHSSSLQQLQPGAAQQRAPPGIAAATDVNRRDTTAAAAVNEAGTANSVNELGSIRSATMAEAVSSEIHQPTAENDAVSPRSSQCSHTESLMCATAMSQVPAEETCATVSSGAPSDSVAQEPSTVSLQPWYATSKGSVGSDISDFDDRNAVDLEVNFESEADILGVETSGDELDRGGTSRDFSEMSSQLTERGISDDDDIIGSSQSESEDGVFNGNPLRITYLRSGSDLSWDESADLPSFAVDGGVVGGNGEIVGLLQFNKT